MDDAAFVKTLNGLLIFVIAGDEFCLNIKDISAIIKPEEIEKYYKLYLPKLSIVRQHADNFPIIDPDKFFGLKQGKITEQTRFILINCDFTIMGLYVDMVKEVISLVKKDGENVLEFSPDESNNPYIKGKIKFEDRVWILPDAEKICGDMYPD